MIVVLDTNIVASATFWRGKPAHCLEAWVAIGRLWQLATVWYDNRLSREYRGRTAADAQAIFRRFGLTSAFWQSDGDQDAPQK